MPLWGGAGLTYINRAQTLLNSTARWCTGLPRRTKTSTLMEKTGWLSIREQIKQATAVLTWKLVYLKKPGRLLRRMTITENNEIEVEDNRLQMNLNGFRWRAASNWNDMRQDLREIKNIDRFKKTAQTVPEIQESKST